jgi:hypothetical protein
LQNCSQAIENKGADFWFWRKNVQILAVCGGEAGLDRAEVFGGAEL